LTDLSPIVDHASPARRVVPSEEAEDDIHCQKKEGEEVEGAIDTVDGKLFIEKFRPEGKGEGDLKFDDVEDDHVEDAPEECEGGERVDVEPTIVPSPLVVSALRETLLVQQSLYCLLDGRRDLLEVQHSLLLVEVD
jgi:hypothetical protein